SPRLPNPLVTTNVTIEMAKEVPLIPLSPVDSEHSSANSIERLLLPNGLKVLHKDEPGSGLVSVQIWVRTGSIHEGAWLGSGMSHFLEHMLFKGTARRDC